MVELALQEMTDDASKARGHGNTSSTMLGEHSLNLKLESKSSWLFLKCQAERDSAFDSSLDPCV